MYPNGVERRFVTRKRMERRTPDGQLLSVTNTRTVHYNDPNRRHSPPVASLPPPPPRHRSHSVSSRRLHPDETLRRASIEYIDPPFVSTDHGNFEEYVREDEFRERRVVRSSPSPRGRSTNWNETNPRRRVEWSDSRRFPEDDYEEIDFNRGQEKIYFGREDSTGGSKLTEILQRINELRRRNGKPDLVPCPRLATAAGRWAEHIVTSGDFRRDINEKMCVWRGRRVSPSIVDSWYDEAVEFRTSNYICMDWLRTVGAGSAYWPEKNQHVVVVIYD